jgi:hypothetical protein
MRATTIQFPDHQSLCVFPENREHLPQAISELYLKESFSVIVLVGGYIPPQYENATKRAIQSIAAFAEENNILVICGGTEVGIMGSIGQTRLASGYRFPLLGITLEKLASWPGGPQSRRFLWWKEDRWPLSNGYSHFILAPGKEFGEDSPWLAEAARYLSRDKRSVTILANGGGVARKDVALSLEGNRPVIVLSGTGRLADTMAEDPSKPALVTIVQAEDDDALREKLQCHLETTKLVHNERR